MSWATQRQTELEGAPGGVNFACDNGNLSWPTLSGSWVVNWPSRSCFLILDRPDTSERSKSASARLVRMITEHRFSSGQNITSTGSFRHTRAKQHLLCVAALSVPPGFQVVLDALCDQDFCLKSGLQTSKPCMGRESYVEGQQSHNARSDKANTLYVHASLVLTRPSPKPGPAAENLQALM